MRAWQVVGTGLGMLALPAAASGGDFDDEPFSLRFPSAISRFSRYPDTAGTGGASAAAVWGSTPNPAGSGWPSTGGTSTQFSAVDFDAGTRIDVASLSHTFTLERFGTFQPSVARAWSNRADTRIGLDLEFESTSAEIQWGLKAWEDAAVGLNLFASGSEIRFGTGGTSVSRSVSDQRGARAGVLLQAAEPLRLGAALEYSRSSDRTTLFAPPGGGADLHARDSTDQAVLQPGMAWEYGKSRRFYVDYRYGALRNGDGTLRVHRFLAGVDHEFVPFLNGRLGLAWDDRGSFSPAFGLGIYPSERVSIDLSWQVDLFPEMRPELGRSRTLGIAVAFSF